MGLFDDLMYNAAPLDQQSGLLGLLKNAVMNPAPKDDSEDAKKQAEAAALFYGTDPQQPPGMTPSPPISTNNLAPPAAPAMAPPGAAPAPAFGAGASPTLFAGYNGPGSMTGLPTPPAAPPVVAGDDEEEDTPPAVPPANAPASPIGVGGGVQMPRVGPAAAFTPQAAPAAAPAVAPPAPAPSPANPASGFLNRTADALQSLSRGGSLLGAVRGQYDDPRALQAQTANLTARALIAKGVDPAVVAAAIQPGNSEMLKALMPVLSPAAYTQETDKDGNVWNVNKQTGQKTVALQQKDDKFQSVKTKDALGSETERAFNTKTGEYGAPVVGAGAGAPGGAGFGDLLAQGVTYDPNKSGPEYMAQFSPEVQAAAKAYMNGDVMPTGNARKNSVVTFAKTVAQKYGQDMGIPVSDTTYGAKRTMQNQLASSSNSSMGGILSNGESSFSHLADATDSMVDMGNASHDYPFGGAIAHGQNYFKNHIISGSDQDAKVGLLVDNLGKYGAESTKFYAGTGGGVEERTAARKDVDPNKVSGEEMAGFAAKEKSLMLDRLNTKFQQIKDTLGEEQGNAIIAKHMPQIQKNIATIDANIARLRGEAPPSAPDASAAAPAPTPLKVGQSATYGNVTIKKVKD